MMLSIFKGKYGRDDAMLIIRGADRGGGNLNTSCKTCYITFSKISFNVTCGLPWVDSCPNVPSWPAASPSLSAAVFQVVKQSASGPWPEQCSCRPACAPLQCASGMKTGPDSDCHSQSTCTIQTHRISLCLVRPVGETRVEEVVVEVCGAREEEGEGDARACYLTA